MWMRGVALISLVMLALVAAAAPAGAGPARASSLAIGFKWLGTTCVPAPGNTVRAQVRVRMIVHNRPTFKNWAQGMKVSVRLEPLGAGLNWTRSWGTQRADGLLWTKKEVRDFTVQSDNVKASADWRLHTKLVWDRPAPIRDVVKEFKSPVALRCTGEVSLGS
jgi:hypothetical protein